MYRLNVAEAVNDAMENTIIIHLPSSTCYPIWQDSRQEGHMRLGMLGTVRNRTEPLGWQYISLHGLMSSRGAAVQGTSTGVREGMSTNHIVPRGVHRLSGTLMVRDRQKLLGRLADETMEGLRNRGR